MIKTLKSSPFLRRNYNRLRMLAGSRSQSNESRIITDLVAATNAPRRFVEFGFHPREFNCINLAGNSEGLLIDGSPETVALAQSLLPGHLSIENRFLTVDNIGFIGDWLAGRPMGVLSVDVDVDGNDFWKRCCR